MFLVEYHKDMGVDPDSGIGCHHRTLRFFKELWQAAEHRKLLSSTERHCAQVREATSDDFWELAEQMNTLAADACAQRNYNLTSLYSAKGTVFTELAAGKAVPEAHSSLLLYAEVQKEDNDG
jgi:hypothetical protein